jgi:hypothetical protein
MNRFVILTTGMLVFSSLLEVSAQVDYQPGYVLSSKGDTLRGFIDYRDWERAPDAISFRVSIDGPEKKYQPLDIKSFYVSGDLYISGIVNIETSPSREAGLSDNAALQIQPDTAFLQALVIGEKSLYRYHYSMVGNSKEQFYIRQNDQFELLTSKFYLTEVSGKQLVATNKLYVNQLALYLHGCATIQKKMRAMRYNTQNFERLFRSYYQCTQTKPEFKARQRKSVWEIGALAGVTSTSVKFTAPINKERELTGPSFSDNLSFTGGLFFDLVQLRNKRMWSFNSELMYTSYKTEGGGYTLYESENRYDHYYTKLEYSYAKMNFMARFKYPIGRFHVFANVGFSYGYMMSGEDYQKRTSRYSPTFESITEGKAFDNGTRKQETGSILGIGMRYQRYSFETRLENTSGMVNAAGVAAHLQKGSLLLSYRFTK